MGETRSSMTAFVAALGTSAFVSASWGAYLSVDFQSDTTGSAPAGTNYILDDASTRVEVVDGSSSPLDPFGGAGNKSLLIEDDSDQLDGRATFSGVGPGLTAGKASFDFYVVNDSGAGFTNASADVRFGIETLSSGSHIAAWLLPDGTTFGILQGAGVGGFITLDNTVTPNVKHTVEITFDTTTDTFTGTLDGIPLTDQGGTVSTFNFYTPMTEITSGSVGNWYSSGVDNRTFYDNLAIDVIPEPSSMALTAGLGMLVMARRRRTAH